MVDDPAQFRLKAKACRRLADIAEDEQRRALWIERADHWEQLAAKAAKGPQQRIKRNAVTDRRQREDVCFNFKYPFNDGFASTPYKLPRERQALCQFWFENGHGMSVCQ
jgi:hypothetical protein